MPMRATELAQNEIAHLRAENERLLAALQEIADCDRRNGMVLGGYEALHIARRALSNEQKVSETKL